VERRLVVELDVGQHSVQVEADRFKRSAFMTSRGFRVLRFANDQALLEMEGAAGQILAALGERAQS
jgi:very-short-patch-repair endonuclease